MLYKLYVILNIEDNIKSTISFTNICLIESTLSLKFILKNSQLNSNIDNLKNKILGI